VLFRSHQTEKLVEPRVMPVDKYLELMKILEKDGYKGIYMYLSGEPMLLHEDFYKYIQYARDRGISVNTATKLPVSLNLQDLKDVVYKDGPKVTFEVTIDAWPGETSAISPSLNMAVVWNNLRLLSQIKTANFRVRCLTVVNKHNEPNLCKIRDSCKALGFSWTPKAMGYYMGKKADPQNWLKIYAMLPVNPKWHRFGKLAVKKTVCRSQLKPVISPEGDVSICCHDMLFVEKVANVFDVGSLKRIIVRRSFREKTEKGSRMRLYMCRGCN
jgi:MoaA/NifB/PqqE/SkfB family radical SAM enzyme